MEYIYHITPFENFEKILESGYLFCKNRVENTNIKYTNIAYEGIQDKRKQTLVPLVPNGNLHDYVPFHFAPRSPMLYCVHRGTIEGCNKNQNEILHLVVKIEDVSTNNLSFVFTNGHPIVFYTDFFNNLNDLASSIDWDIMKSEYWNNTLDDRDRKTRRQAEFLIHNEVSVNLIHGIGVYNDAMQTKVNDLLQNMDVQIQCKVISNWYY